MFKQWLTTLLLLTLLSTNSLATAFAQPANVRSSGDCNEDDFEVEEYENQVVVKLVDPNDTATIDAIVLALNVQLVDTVLASRGIYLLEVAMGDDAEDLNDQIMAQWPTQLVYAEANYQGDIPEANPSIAWAWGGEDPAPIGTQYANTMLNLSAAQQLSQGAGVTVAIIDTGIQTDHPFFSTTQVLTGYDFIDDDFTPDDTPDGADSDGDGIPNEAVGHGTHVAGIVHTVAPKAKLMPLRVLDGDGGGNLFVIAEAIVYAAENGADVISLSLGSVFESDVLEEAVDVAVEEYGVVIVAAAGNSNTTQPHYPAAFGNKVLAVTSIDQNSVKASAASYGCWVDIAAPGESIFSSFPTDGYAWWSGTSMATPFIAGQAALLKSRQLSGTARGNDDIVQVIVNTADPIDAQNVITYTGMLGAGLPNMVTALNTIEQVPTQVGMGVSGVDSAEITLTITLLTTTLLAVTILLRKRQR